MNSIIKKIVCFWKVKQRKKKILQMFLKTYNLKLIVNRETSIVLSCLTPTLNKKTGKHDLVADDGTVLDRDLSISEATKKIEAYKKAAKRKKISIQEHLDDIAENIKRINLRKAALTRWLEKFELKFHKHFDGEIEIRYQNDGVTIARRRMVGAHNHEQIGKRFDIIAIRKPQGVTLESIPNNIPFKANVKMTENGIEYTKQATSTFFPLNWDITRVKEEIALIYGEFLKSGKTYHMRQVNRKFDFINSEGTFKIRIEFDNLDNFTNAYPLIN